MERISGTVLLSYNGILYVLRSCLDIAEFHFCLCYIQFNSYLSFVDHRNTFIEERFKNLALLVIFAKFLAKS